MSVSIALRILIYVGGSMWQLQDVEPITHYTELCVSMV